jgi:predicted aspartyl protease
MPTYTARLESRLEEDYPAPYVTVRVSWRGQSRDLPGLIDSGADGTTIPKFLVGVLNLEKIDDVTIDDANGGSREEDLVVADVELHGFSIAALPVAAIDYPFILIGRDILSQLVTELNGPAITFSLSGPATLFSATSP